MWLRRFELAIPSGNSTLDVRSAEFFRAVSPVSHPIADSTHTISEIAFIVCRLELSSGITGEGCLLSFDYSPEAIQGALRDIGQSLIGLPVYEVGRLSANFNQAAEYFGREGPNRWALGIVNIALWDAWAKALQVPIWRLFGSYRDKIPVYGSGGWLSYDIPELVEEAKRYVTLGFRGIKIKVGSPEVSHDVERLARVREAVGPGIALMMDANQGMSVGEATILARRAQSLDIQWFEEPISNVDFDGYRHLREATGISLAMGEREYNVVALTELIARNAIDLWQPDILRLGGVDAWRESAAVARAHNLPVLPHFYKEYDVPLLCTVGNAVAAEYFDWMEGLVDHPLTIEDGFARPSERPGWGFSFADKRLSALP